MGYRYQTGDRIYGGSIENRLSPRITERQLNARFGPDRPRPMVRETSSGCVYENGPGARRARIGLPSRFDKE